MKLLSNQNSITLGLLYYEVEKRNKKHSSSLRVSKLEKICLVFLGWEEMNGRKVKLVDLKQRRLESVIQKLIKKELVNHGFKPIDKGRKFFYEVVGEVCKFFVLYTKYGLTKEGVDVDYKEVKRIIV